MTSVLGSCSTELLHMVAKHHTVFRLNTVAHGTMKVSGDAPTLAEGSLWCGSCDSNVEGCGNVQVAPTVFGLDPVVRLPSQ